MYGGMDREGDIIVLLSYTGMVDLDALVLDISLALTRYFTGKIPRTIVSFT